MIRSAFLAALVLLAAPAIAQEPAPAARSSLVGAEPRAAGQAPAARLFEIHSGRLWLDGRALPEDAVPEGLDLSGVLMQMEFAGAATPVLEVDGRPYVLEGERLVPFESSSKQGNPVYILGEYVVAPEAASADRLQPVVTEAYRRQLSGADQELYAKMEREGIIEGEIRTIASRARELPPGDEYDDLAEELRQRLRDLFDLKQEIRAEELDRAESDLRALRAILAERDAMREEIVDRRLRELMGESPIDR